MSELIRTGTERLTIGSVDRALAAAGPKLAAQQQQLAVWLYRLLARGGPVSADALAAAAGQRPEAVRAQLDAWPAVFLDDDRRVVGFWGLALPRMAHRLLAGGVELWAWCAWDPLFLAHLIGLLTVTTRRCVSSGLPIEAGPRRPRFPLDQGQSARRSGPGSALRCPTWTTVARPPTHVGWTPIACTSAPASPCCVVTRHAPSG